jgi:predicted dehydrogenase
MLKREGVMAMSKTTTIVVGTGGMARWHIRGMLKRQRTTAIVGLVEPAEASREATRAVYAELKAECPPFYGTIRELIRSQGVPDTAFICTPHKYHLENTRDCLLAGMDVLLEKPMVMNGREARTLMAVRDRTRRLVVVAFPGSLSPAVRKAKDMIRAGRIGEVNSVCAWVHQQWKRGTTGRWRQDPAISGGGFLFDTGSHMVNTVIDLVGEDLTEVRALLDNRGTPVEINASVSARTAGGVTITMNAAGECVHCTSGVLVFGTAGVLETGIWGERLNLKTAKDGQFKPVPLPKGVPVWEQFLRVRAGRMPNPCPAEIGLRFAKVMDMIRRAARA